MQEACHADFAAASPGAGSDRVHKRGLPDGTRARESACRLQISWHQSFADSVSAGLMHGVREAALEQQECWDEGGTAWWKSVPRPRRPWRRRRWAR